MTRRDLEHRRTHRAWVAASRTRSRVRRSTNQAGQDQRGETSRNRWHGRERREARRIDAPSSSRAKQQKGRMMNSLVERSDR